MIHQGCRHRVSQLTVYLWMTFFLVSPFSTASAAKIFRSGCDSERKPPEFSTQVPPAGTPHVGQRMEDNCFRVSSFTFISCLRRSCFLDGHRAIFQELDDQRAVYLQAAVVADQSLLLKIIHEFTYPWTGGTDHLR
jgi:hypothetical protein